MQLLRERDREEIRKYEGIKSAGLFNLACGDPLSGTMRKCTRKALHTGPHMAHGIFGRIMAVWDPRPTPPPVDQPAEQEQSSSPLSFGSYTVGDVVQVW